MKKLFAMMIITPLTRAIRAARSRRREHVGVAVLCLCGLFATAAPAWSQGTFTTIDAPGAGTSMFEGTMGISVNAAGDVAGIYLDASLVAHGFILPANGTIATFVVPAAGTGAGQGTFPISINASGVIAGTYFDANYIDHGFIRAADGTITTFDVSAAAQALDRGTYPDCIDAAGDVAGFYKDANATRHGFIRAANGTITTFDVTGAGAGYVQGTVPISINASGVITGYYTDSSGLDHGFIRANGTFTAPIDVPGASTTGGLGKDLANLGTLPMSIDAAGDITGFYADANGSPHGFLRTASGTFTNPIDAPGAGTGTITIGAHGGGLHEGTYASSINSAGVIAGIYIDSNALLHGFVLPNNGTFTAPLDDPNAGGVGSSLIPGTGAVSINDSGILTGGYFDASGVLHGFVLTLTPTATPTFSVPTGTYTSAQTVTISDATTGETIYYTADGSTPTTTSTPYTGAITVSSTETLQAIALAPGYSPSAVASAVYTISLSPPTASVSPTSLTFSGQATGTTSASQPVKLSNTGSAALTISSITASTSFGETNNCGGSVAANSFCTINVTFSPTASGAVVGSLTITDNTNGVANSTQTVVLNGTGQDFSFAPPSGSSTSATAAPGSPATYTLSVGGEGGLTGSVSFTCTGAPSEATCSVSPNPATVGSTPTNVTVTVTTTAASMSVPRSRPLPPVAPFSPGAKGLLMLALTLALAWIFIRRHQPVVRRWQILLFPLSAGLLLALALAGCGGGSGKVASNPGTPAGTYTLTVTGSSGSGSSSLSHSVTLTLTVS